MRWRKRCRYTHEELAKRLGKSRTSVTESLGPGTDARHRQKALSAGRHFPKSLLLQIVRQQSPEKMSALVEQLTRRALAR
jgi:ParB family chromosome partitioning protein